MGYKSFDSYAQQYDSWFIENSNVLESEVKLVASCLDNAGEVLSIGCGSGLFEKILADDNGITIRNGIEPSATMAEIAVKRGMDVMIATGEEADYGIEEYDTVSCSTAARAICRIWDWLCRKPMRPCGKGARWL